MSSTATNTQHHDDIEQNLDDKQNLIVNGTFTDADGNASTEPWIARTASTPIRIPGGLHQLSLFRAEHISQVLNIKEDQEFYVHYSFLAAASNPSPGTYIRVKVGNRLAEDEVDIVVNNKLLYPRSRIGTQRFSLRGGELTVSFANETINSDRFISLTDIRLWIEPV